MGSMKSAVLLAALVSASAAAAVPAARHNRLVKAEPAVDTTVAKSPAQIRLWFKEPVEPSVSSIKLADLAGKTVSLGDTKATDDRTSIAAQVPTPLEAGAYTVTWKTAGRDGHVIRGSFGFTVRP